MIDKKECILLVQDDLKKIVGFAQKCVEAGIDESSILATVNPEDISRFLNTKNISVIIIDSDLYNLNSASIIKNYSLEQDLQVLLVTSQMTKKTIRMIMDKNLKYINANILSNDLGKILGTVKEFSLKKVMHL